MRKPKDDHTLLVTGSTYPRWPRDNVPPFIQQLCHAMTRYYDKVFVIVPHYKGAKRVERDQDVFVRRFRYMIPESAQNIVYSGGGVFKIKKTPWYAVKLIGYVAAEFFSMMHTIMSQKVSVINAHWIVPQGFIAIIVKFLTRKKVVVSVHGADILSLKGCILTAVKYFILRNADHIIANSPTTLKECQRIYPKVPASVIPMGVDLEYFKPGEKPAALVKKYQLTHTFTLLFVGRLTVVKGVSYLLEAARQLQESGVSFKLLIIGEGPDQEALEQYVEKHDLTQRVIFIGWVDKNELPDYYRLADVFVGPSLHEALGLVFIEAQSSGLPVVATKVGGIGDMVRNGETGFLVERKNSRALYDKLSILYEDNTLRQSMAKKARSVVSEQFSWENVSARYHEVLKQAADS